MDGIPEAGTERRRLVAWTSRPAAQVILSSLKAAPSPHLASRPFTPTCLSCERAQCPGWGGAPWRTWHRGVELTFRSPTLRSPRSCLRPPLQMVVFPALPVSQVVGKPAFKQGFTKTIQASALQGGEGLDILDCPPPGLASVLPAASDAIPHSVI